MILSCYVQHSRRMFQAIVQLRKEIDFIAHEVKNDDHKFFFNIRKWKKFCKLSKIPFDS